MADGPYSGINGTLNATSAASRKISTAQAKHLDAPFFFAHPYSSWERGSNENANGLIRQYLPKDRDFTTITQAEINRVMDRLNNRPRKCLGIKTPNQVFFGINPSVALAS